MCNDIRKHLNLFENVEFLEETKAAQYNLKARYDEFNQKFFNNELPEIPLKFGTLKNSGGVVKFKVSRVGPKPTARTIRYGLNTPNTTTTLIPGTLTMVISDAYQRSEAEFDGLLLHEMIHVYFAHTGKYYESHGPLFMKMLRELSQRSGMDIPLTDDTSTALLSNDAVKPVGVVIVEKKSGGFSFAMYNPNVLTTKIEEFKAVWERYNPSYAKEVRAYLVTGPAWTRMAMEVPVGRLPKKGNFYRLDDEDKEKLFAEIAEHGEVVAELKIS
jgi:hypothetical protein